MAKPKKLKVFRTAIGFHDAYVAAPSQKAALEAWGSDSNLFAAGAAELVSEPKLMKEPLARPGEVVRVLRGSAEEQIEALGKLPAKAKNKEEAGPDIQSGVTKKKKPKPKPKPSRAGVDKAEAALERAEAKHRDALAKLKEEEQALEKRRRKLERKQSEEREQLTQAVEEAREQYRAAMAEWAE